MNNLLFSLFASSYINFLKMHLVSFLSFISLHKLFILFNEFVPLLILLFIQSCFLDPIKVKVKGNFLYSNLELCLL